MSEQHFKPALGYAVVEFVAPGKTRGGIDIPDSAAAELAKLYMVLPSRGHFQEGQFVECSIPTDARVWIAASTRMAPNPHKRGEYVQQEYLRTMKIDALPDNQRLIMLCDVICWEEPARLVQ